MSIKKTPALTTSAIGSYSPNAYFINSLTIDGVPDIAKALATSYSSISNKSPEEAIALRITADPKVVALSSFYIDATRFIGGNTSCPDFVKPSESILPKNPSDWKTRIHSIAGWMDVKARMCYLYYVLNHATKPWLTLERPGLSADDPHTNTNPNQAILQTCQPLVRGDVADFIQFPHSQYESKTNMRKLEERSGFAHVNASSRPDINENEYVLNYSLASQWYANFLGFGGGGLSIDNKLLQGGGKILKDFQATYNKFINTTISPPCVVYAGGSGGGGGVYGSRRSKIWYPPNKCPQWLCYGFWHSAGPIREVSKGSNSGYCPNVERIIDPSGPFNPRNEYVRDVYSRAVPLMNSEYASRTGDDDSTVQPSSDRSYSTFTSIFFLREYRGPCCEEGRVGTWTPSSGAYCNNNPRDPECGARSCHRWKCGYTSYNCIQPRTPPYYQWTWHASLKKKYPPVQCAVVPVEIMNFRFDSFHSCITQRIAINFNRWIDQGAPNFNGLNYGRDKINTTPDIHEYNGDLAQAWMKSKHTNSPSAYSAWGTQVNTDPNIADRSIYKPACATRYWETDNAYDCPTPTSIQQCCRFITKDLVPTNFLKLRTCEGLLHKRTAAKERMEAIGVITSLTFDPFDPDRKWPENGGNPPDYAKAVVWINEYATGSSNGVGKHQHVVAEAGNRILNDYSCDAVEHAELRFRTGRNFFRDPYTGESLGAHMPYMRWWDTGVSAGNVHRGGSFGNTLGTWDVVVGVGREERTAAEAYYAKQKASAQQHHLGNQQPTPQFSINGARGSEISRINGWEGILAHQMQSIRRFNLNCLTRYEKTFKPYSAEDFVLASAGGSYNNTLGRKMPWPLGWRGYLSSGQFPVNVQQVSPNNPKYKGLDNARRGDIIIYALSDGQWHMGYVEYADYTPDTRGAVNTNPKWDFEKAEFSGMSKAPNNLYVVSWDQGRFPTATGATTYQGIGARRQIMKQEVPKFYKDQVCKKKLLALTSKGDEIDMTCQNPITAQCSQCEPSCDDPDYKYCVLPIVGGQHSWDTAYIYRPAWDSSRQALGATYTWWEKQKEKPTKPFEFDPSPGKDENVILQALTYKYSSSSFATLVNMGYDPPWFWFMGGYKGPGTGAVTDLTFKGGKWGLSNSKVDKSKIRCFRGNGDGGQSCK
jgi:hypothetical protein